MSAPLKDFRMGITSDVDVALEGFSRGWGISRAEVALQVLSEWAVKVHTASRVVNNLAAANGVPSARAGERQAIAKPSSTEP